MLLCCDLIVSVVCLHDVHVCACVFVSMHMLLMCVRVCSIALVEV